jgi:hypothetical protein
LTRPVASLGLAFVFAAGCGGASSRAEREPLPPVAPDAGAAAAPVTTAAPAVAAPTDHCGGYAVAVAPILGRIARSAEVFLQTLGSAKQAAQVVDAAAALASSLDAEKPALAAIHSADPPLDAAHGRLTAALAGFAAAVRGLGASYTDASQAAARERASQDLNSAIRAWADAVAGIQAVCPALD